MSLAALGAALRAHGLLLRGAFHPRAEDAVPAPAAGTVALVGNAGPALWRVFARSPEARDGRPHPLDRWTRRILDAIAADLGARTLYPFDGPPHLPFQRWALRAEPVHVSPLGLLIHPAYGLWHAYRGALTFPGRLALPPRPALPSPCAGCAGRPCLSACPVAAFTAGGYAAAACRRHLAAPAGEPCMGAGCLARRACPVGRDYAYVPQQAALHMRAFLAGAGPPASTAAGDRGREAVRPAPVAGTAAGEG